jgi:hypothetical protein
MNILKIAPVVMFLIVSFAGAPWGVGQTTDNIPPNVKRNKASHVDELPVVFKEDFEKGLARWEIIDDQSWKLEEHGAGKSLSIIRRNSEYEPKVRSPHHIDQRHRKPSRLLRLFRLPKSYKLLLRAPRSQT